MPPPWLRPLPARTPPDEALVEPSSTPWRVFDAPTAAGASASAGSDRSATGTSPPAVGSVGPATNQVLAVAGVLGAVAIGGLAVVIAMSGTGGEVVDGPATVGAAVGSDAPGAVAGEIVVDVAGAVVAPGVYRLPPGSRVGDAITAAGGFSPRVDVDRAGLELNLAATLSDGVQIRVPSRDDAVEPGGGDPGDPGGGGAGGHLVNLNTASQTELETLPGIGPVTAGKIIESRAGARFTKVEELRERGLVGEKTFESLRALVTV